MCNTKHTSNTMHGLCQFSCFFLDFLSEQVCVMFGEISVRCLRRGIFFCAWVKCSTDISEGHLSHNVYYFLSE